MFYRWIYRNPQKNRSSIKNIHGWEKYEKDHQSIEPSTKIPKPRPFLLFPYLIRMPLLAIGEFAVLHTLLAAQLPLPVDVGEVDGVPVARERGTALGSHRVGHAGNRLVPHRVLAFVEATLMGHRAHYLQSLDRIGHVAHVPIVRCHAGRVDRLGPRGRLEPRWFRDTVRLHGRVHRQAGGGHATETVLMIQKAGGCDRARDHARPCDRALQDRSPRQLAALFAHRLPQSRLLRIVHVVCEETKKKKKVK